MTVSPWLWYVKECKTTSPKNTFKNHSPSIAGYRILRELGRGGGGIVYLAIDPKLGRQVAIKVPQPEVVYTPHLRRRFMREARLVAQLNHPHVVPVYETAEAGPICYIVSAFCGTLTLAKWLQHRDTPVPGRTQPIRIIL